MKIKARIAGLVLAAATAFAGAVNADDWSPDGPLMFQIGFGAGGSTDTMGRVLAKVMKDQTGWNIIAENKTGGGGVAMFTGISKMPPPGEVTIRARWPTRLGPTSLISASILSNFLSNLI